jgi:hypothetical protein
MYCMFEMYRPLCYRAIPCSCNFRLLNLKLGSRTASRRDAVRKKRIRSKRFHTECSGRIHEWIVGGQTPRAWKIRAAARVFHTKAHGAGLGMKKTACAELPWRAGRLQISAAVEGASQSFDWASRVYVPVTSHLTGTAVCLQERHRTPGAAFAEFSLEVHLAVGECTACSHQHEMRIQKTGSATEYGMDVKHWQRWKCTRLSYWTNFKKDAALTPTGCMLTQGR